MGSFPETYHENLCFICVFFNEHFFEGLGKITVLGERVGCIKWDSPQLRK